MNYVWLIEYLETCKNQKQTTYFCRYGKQNYLLSLEENYSSCNFKNTHSVSDYLESVKGFTSTTT